MRAHTVSKTIDNKNRMRLRTWIKRRSDDILPCRREQHMSKRQPLTNRHTPHPQINLAYRALDHPFSLSVSILGFTELRNRRRNSRVPRAAWIALRFWWKIAGILWFSWSRVIAFPIRGEEIWERHGCGRCLDCSEEIFHPSTHICAIGAWTRHCWSPFHRWSRFLDQRRLCQGWTLLWRLNLTFPHPAGLVWLVLEWSTMWWGCGSGHFDRVVIVIGLNQVVVFIPYFVFLKRGIWIGDHGCGTCEAQPTRGARGSFRILTWWEGEEILVTGSRAIGLGIRRALSVVFSHA